MSNKTTRGEILKEISQSHETRMGLFKEIEKIIKIPIVTFYTSFNYPVSISDVDATMMADILSKLKLQNGFALMINSPGGSGVSAERIIRICRSYSGTDSYVSIVPDKAKSAATMICFGSQEITMGVTSELGPIDPQIIYETDEGIKLYSAYDIVKSYEQLFNEAVGIRGHIEPFLQQLDKYDYRDINLFKRELDLSKDIALKTLKEQMCKKLSKKQIEKNIAIFLTPESTKTHSRPIFIEEAKKCSLNIKELKPRDKLWELLQELHIRSNNFVNTEAAKLIESHKYHFFTPPPPKEKRG